VNSSDLARRNELLDGGYATAFVVVLTLALMAVIGLAVDGECDGVVEGDVGDTAAYERSDDCGVDRQRLGRRTHGAPEVEPPGHGGGRHGALMDRRHAAEPSPGTCRRPP
jgi:hypothetical protein